MQQKNMSDAAVADDGEVEVELLPQSWQNVKKLESHLSLLFYSSNFLLLKKAAY